MKISWDISKKQWDDWIEQLHCITFHQKRYQPKIYIHQEDPVLLYKYYGFVEHEKFIISPSNLGLNQMPVTFFGRASKQNDGYKLTVNIQFAPYIRRMVCTVFSLLTIFFIGAIFLVKSSDEISFLYGFGILLIVIAIVWASVAHAILQTNAKRHIPFFENMLGRHR